MPDTLFLFATEGEAARFRTLRSDASVEIIGVGVAEAATAAAEYIAKYAPQRVVLAGIAGACDEQLQVGECVAVVNDCLAGLPESYRKEYRSEGWGDLPKVVAYTVSRTGESLPSGCGVELLTPAIEQMEGAGVAAVCQRAGVEYLHLRAISNRVADNREEWRIPEAIDSLTAVLIEMCDS